MGVEWAIDDSYISVGMSNNSCYIFDVSDSNPNNWFKHRVVTDGGIDAVWLNEFLITCGSGGTSTYWISNFTKSNDWGSQYYFDRIPGYNYRFVRADALTGSHEIKIFGLRIGVNNGNTVELYSNTMADEVTEVVASNSGIFTNQINLNRIYKFSSDLSTSELMLSGSGNIHKYLSFDISNDGNYIALGCHASQEKPYVFINSTSDMTNNYDILIEDNDTNHYNRCLEFDSNNNIYFGTYYNGYGTDEDLYFYTLSDGMPETPEEEEYIYVNLFDSMTGANLFYYEEPFVGSIQSTANIAWGKFYLNSELVTISETGYTIKLDLDSSIFSDGSYNTLSFKGYADNNPRGFTNEQHTTWSNYTVTRTFHSGNTYDIYLTPVDFESNEDMTNYEEYVGNGPTYWYLGTDKYNYTKGEQLIIKYKFPSKQELADSGYYPSFGFQITIHKNGIGWWERTWGDYAGTSVYINPEELVYGNYGYLYIDTNNLDADEGVTDYEVNIFSPDQGLFWVRHNPSNPDGLWFRIVDGVFNPTGTISSVNPSEPYIGQNVNISFIANNRGKLTYTDIIDPSGEEWLITEFTKPLSTIHTFTSFYNPSTYKIIEYVWNGYEYVEVDNDFIYVNTSDGNHTGHNIEYMEISRDRYIAGYSFAEIAYNTLDTTAKFVITTPKGEQSRYSTILTDTGPAVYRFFIHKDSPIGKYTVTLVGLNGNYTSYFYVVYDEFNYVEFGKHTYYKNEQFDIYLKHDNRVGLIFYKENQYGNWIPQGQTIYFEKGLDVGYYPVPRSIVAPSPGNWKVEMYSVNNRVPIRLLATHETVVIELPIDDEIIINDGTILPPLDPVLGAIAGLIITMFCIISPMIILKGLKASQNLPAVTYALTGSLGIIISVLLGMFPFWVLPFILIVGIIILLMQYVINNRGQNGGE